MKRKDPPGTKRLTDKQKAERLANLVAAGTGLVTQWGASEEAPEDDREVLEAIAAAAWGVAENPDSGGEGVMFFIAHAIKAAYFYGRYQGQLDGARPFDELARFKDDAHD